MHRAAVLSTSFSLPFGDGLAMRSHAQDGAGFPSNQHYFHFIFILNEAFRAPWFCFLEEGEQHGTRTGVTSATGPKTSNAPELQGRACARKADGHLPLKAEGMC